MSKTVEYSAWSHMIQRCSDEGNSQYENYGGRGIKVCDRWLESFENFLADMGMRPKDMSLDRIDVNGNYEPENCRWATDAEQQNNRRNNRVVEFKGEVRTLQEWSRITGIKREVIAWRLNKGWPIIKALSTLAT